MSENTSIHVSRETKSRLAQLGIKGETYDGIIQRLLDKLKKKDKPYPPPPPPDLGV